jgi:uncharacterized glyoxalase superfamily protein PhnB
MKENPSVIPMIAYEDGLAALAWLSEAFGFHERTRMVGENGSLSHAEMEAGDGLIMLATPTPDYESPGHHRQQCEAARKWSSVPWSSMASWSTWRMSIPIFSGRKAPAPSSCRR